jgi:two-component system phosphate regulon sensor histidine kinase PhoR
MWIPWPGPLKKINAVLKRLLSGDLSARVASPDDNTFDSLGDHINQLAARYESALRTQAQDSARLLTVLTNMVEAVVAVDAQGRVLIANPAFSSLFGVNANAARGIPLVEVLRHTGLNELMRVVLDGKKETMDTIRTWAPDEREFEAHAMPLLENDRFMGALLVLHDITRINKLEQIRKDFVANVSHELRTPLAAIKGFAETLSTGGIDDQDNRLSFVKSIESQADRMTALVDDLLDLTAIESGKNAPVKEPLLINDIVSDVIDSLKPLANRKSVLFHVDASMARLPAVSCDKKQIKQVLTNLLQNAVKYNKDGGRITIDAEQQDAHVTLFIRDTGAGIPAADLPRIFERFYRVDKARSREMGGTGLGLAIVKHIIEAHGGTVSVESTLGEGSTFRFNLPL